MKEMPYWSCCAGKEAKLNADRLTKTSAHT